MGGDNWLNKKITYFREAMFSLHLKKWVFLAYLDHYVQGENTASTRRTDETLGDLDRLTRVYWDDIHHRYTLLNGKPIDLVPLKTMPLNFHWSWNSGEHLGQGLASHITEEGIHQGADTYFLSHMVSGHSNPMYALTFFKKKKDYPGMENRLS